MNNFFIYGQVINNDFKFESMNFSIEQPVCFRTHIRPGDIGLVTRFHGEIYYQEYKWDWTFEAYVAEGMAKFALAYNSTQDRLWLAELEGVLVGCIAIAHYSNEDAQLRWYLVHPGCRGRGLGRRLMEAALQFCRDNNYKRIFLWTTSNLYAAAHLYRSFGFEKTEQRTSPLWGDLVTQERYDLDLE